MSATTASKREEQRAQDLERERLLRRWRELAPHDRCFCGSLEDLRRHVADLEARQAREPGPRPAHQQHRQHEQDHDEQQLDDEEIEP